MWIGSVVPKENICGDYEKRKQGLQIEMKTLNDDEEEGGDGTTKHNKKTLEDKSINLQTGDEEERGGELPKEGGDAVYLCDRPSWGETLGAIVGFIGMAVPHPAPSPHMLHNITSTSHTTRSLSWTPRQIERRLCWVMQLRSWVRCP